MSPFPYDVLWHYSEKFTRDPDLRQDLVLLAWKEDARLGGRSEIRLLKNFIKLRAKEIHKRSPLGNDISGKKKGDAWNHDPVSIFKPLVNERGFCIADTLTAVDRNPLSHCIVHDFEHALPQLEEDVARHMISGYLQQETMKHLHITPGMFYSARASVRELAMEYLV